MASDRGAWALRRARATESALRDVHLELHRAGRECSGRALKAILVARHARDVIDAALDLGRTTGALAYQLGPRRAWLYRTLEPSPDIRRVTDLSGHSASLSTPGPGPDTQPPDTQPSHTQPSDTQSPHLRPDTQALDQGDEHQAAIAANRCCGKGGSQLRCKLCRWSRTYSPALGALRASGRTAFDARDVPMLAALHGASTTPAKGSTLEPVRRLTDAELEAACAELRTVPRTPFVPKDPYRPLDPDATPVDFSEESYVRRGRHD